MIEPRHPSLEGSPPAAALNGRATAATGRPPGENNQQEDQFDTDELIIDLKKVALLRDNVDRIEENFHVIVGLGMRATEDIEMQWITIQGIAEDRALAKSYIKALCSPGKYLAFNFPDDLHQTLTHPNVLDRLEKQSNTAILFPSRGHAVIQGEDDLAVTLAMSAIEDIIQHMNIPEVSSPNTSTGEVSERLDRELRRLSSQTKELYGEEYDMECLTSLPGPVKRTLLRQYIDDTRQHNVDEQPKCNAANSRDPEETIPMRLAESSSVPTLSERPFVDLHPTTKSSASNSQQQLAWCEGDLRSMASLSHSSSSLSLSLNLNDECDAYEIIDLTNSPPHETTSSNRASPLGASSSSPDSNLNQVIAPMVDGRHPSPIPTQTAQAPSLTSEALNFALNSGYNQKEIEEVQSIYGDLLTTAQFLQVLHTNRREKAQKHAVTVSDLEAAHMPRPTPGRINKVETIDKTVSDSNQSNEEQERPVTPSGKQQSHKTHNQGPRMKKGKLSKSPVKPLGKKSQARRNRRSPSEETTEKMEVVSLLETNVDKTTNSLLPNAMRDMLQSSPHTSAKKKPGSKGDVLQLNEYLRVLTKDYDEEDTSDIEEMRKRNTVRRKLLEPLLEPNQRHKQENPSDIVKESAPEDANNAEVEGTDWTTASRNGRHRFPKLSVGADRDQKHKAIFCSPSANSGSSTKPKKLDPTVAFPSTSGSTKPKPLDQDRASRFCPEEKLVGSLDALDDFSLPPAINVHSTDSQLNPSAQQHGARNNNNNAQHRQTRFSKQTIQRTPIYNQSKQQYTSHQPQPLVSVPQPLMQQHPVPMGTVYTSNNGSNVLSKSNLRYIVLDGSNLAMTHGNHQVFSCKGIKICIDYFRRRGHTEITAFVPQWRTHAPRPDYPMRDQYMLEELRKEGLLVFTPARRVPGKNIVCYDDKFVLRLAQETDGVIVSNDNYRDLWHEKREWRQIIEDRLLMFSFVGDIFMPPDDPLGRNGPHLDEFLRKCNIISDWSVRDQQVQLSRQQRDNGSHLYNGHNPGHGPLAMWGHPLPQGQLAKGRPIQNQGAQNQAPVLAFDYNHMSQVPNQNNQFQDHFPHKPQGYSHGPGLNQGQGYFPHQPSGHANINQNAAGGARPRIDGSTEWLKKKLLVIFAEKEAKIDEVLELNPTEKDINKIIEYMLESN